MKPLDKLTIPEVMPHIWAYRDIPGNEVGGSLHVVLDEANVDNKTIEWCIKYAEEKKDTEGARIGRLLFKMSRTQRLKIAARFYENR